MLLHLSVSHSVHRAGVPGQVHPQTSTPPDQVHPQTRYTPGPGTPPTRYTPQTRYNPPGQGTPPRTRYTPQTREIWATSGWYASYWNVFLFSVIFNSPPPPFPSESNYKRSLKCTLHSTTDFFVYWLLPNSATSC